MTTVCANHHEMAADSRTSSDAYFIATEGKIYRIGDDIIGCAGNLDSISKFVEWYAKRGERPDFTDDDFEAIALTHDGLFFYSNSTRARRVIGPFVAAGSGELAAAGAMHAGASPKRAVEIAILCDKNSGGPVVVERLKRKSCPPSR